MLGFEVKNATLKAQHPAVFDRRQKPNIKYLPGRPGLQAGAWTGLRWTRSSSVPAGLFFSSASRASRGAGQERAPAGRGEPRGARAGLLGRGAGRASSKGDMRLAGAAPTGVLMACITIIGG